MRWTVPTVSVATGHDYRQPATGPEDLAEKDRAVLYVRSYFLIRRVVGLMGISLPVVFIVGEAYFLRGGVHFRGSLSAYYHSSMRDLFVAGLCTTGLLLATYLAGQPNTSEFWLSLVAGLAVLVVVFFPTQRPGLTADAPRCGSLPAPSGCSPVQQRLGEEWTSVIHFFFAAVFILSLAAIAFLFAREQYRNRKQLIAWIQKACGWVIVAAVLLVIVGELWDVTLGELTPLYVGEVASVWAFGASWLLSGWSR
jgi:hypothetical protein